MAASHMSRVGRKLRATVTATNNGKSLRLRTTLMEIAVPQTASTGGGTFFASAGRSASKREHLRGELT
jgi:hypothetical protein